MSEAGDRNAPYPKGPRESDAEIKRLRTINAELLAAVKGVLNVDDYDSGAWHEAWVCVRAAIAKAEEPAP